MDTHHAGPRGKTTKGAVVTCITAGAKFGDANLAAVEIFRTSGASTGLGFVQVLTSPQVGVTARKYPLFVRFSGYLVAGFDGTGPVFTISETNLDDSGSVNILTIGSFSANAAGGSVSVFKMLTADKKYKFTYTQASGSPTAGEGYVAIELVGPGLPSFTISAAGVTSVT